MRLRDNPSALTATTVVLWSTGAVMGKLMSQQEGYLGLLFGLFSAALTLIACRMFVIRRAPSRSLFSLPVIAVGIIGYGLYWLCYFNCFRSSQSAALPVIFNYTWPIFTVIFSHLMKTGSRAPKLTTAVELGGMAAGMLGIWLAVASDTGPGGPFQLAQIGPVMLWGLGAGASYGLFSAYSARIARDDQFDFLLIAVAASSAFLLPFSWDEFGAFIQYSARDLVIIALFGIFSEALGSLSWVRANIQARELGLDISKAASMIFTLPLLSLALISAVFRDSSILRPGFFAGCLLVTGCVIICGRAREIAGRLAPSKVSR